MDARERPQRAIPRDEIQGRIEAIQARLREQRIDGLIIHSPENIYYLTGHHTQGYYMYQTVVVPANGSEVLLVRHGELGNARTHGVARDLRSYDDGEDPLGVTVGIIAELGLASGTLAFEWQGWFLTPAAAAALRERLPDASFADGSAIVHDLRSVKSPREVELVRDAARIASAAMEAGIAAVHDGATEDDVAAEMLSELVRNGSDFLAMEPFVASGPRSGSMHSSWSGRRIRSGDVVLLELAAARGRYHAALMRTVKIGEVAQEFKRWSEVCNSALDAAIDAIRPGVTSGDIDAACRGVIEGAGLYDLFRKRTGYSMGIAFAPDWGEGHLLSLRRDDPRRLEPGMVFHMPPALRIYGIGGVGYSETVLVTDDGCDVLTDSPRGLRSSN